MMIYLRSLLFQIAFYLLTLVQMVVYSPFVFLAPRRMAWVVVPFWARVNLALLRWIAGLKVEYRGVENIPQGGFLVASKHQSAWETFALIPFFPDPTYILKRELRWIPIFGWYTAKMKQIPINRGKRSAALAAMMAAAREAIGEGRQILIFPEGTRRPAGAEPSYKYGISHLYRDLACPVLPVALNAGLYWPRKGFLIHPGKVIVEFLPAIEPGLEPAVFFEKLTGQIETASNRLIEEARQAERPSPVLKTIPPRGA
ncbi:acyl-phosphate glycerol 3-phosphate acyltransferase [Pannonibacter phragmitetus]|uniref:lysophospholipid acyltransferase family protein n=2 Tax=Pannonibacter phragmitetus TaxID=121719 RepID=UPI00067D4319|nr:acyl-phosphate glycerol 3-phosphate acyltransferase [Pannonibacter phragmitetus]